MAKMTTNIQQRPFAMVYTDFLRSSKLDIYEKMVFIAIKSYANEKNKAFPSAKTLSKDIGISIRKVQEVLKQLENKKVITSKKRYSQDGGQRSNIYTLNDYTDLWESETEEAEKKEVEKENASSGATNTDKAKNKNKNIPKNLPLDSNIPPQDCQEGERYPLDIIHKLYDYNLMLERTPQDKQEIDCIMGIIYDTLNTNYKTVTISGNKRPINTVFKRFSELKYWHILDTIEAIKSQNSEIKNVRAYVLTCLYQAPITSKLKTDNKINVS